MKDPGERMNRLFATLIVAAAVGGVAAFELPEEAVRGRDFAFCNVGSNSGIYAFDWEGAGVKGLSLATSPQSINLGFELLERYADRLAQGCTVFIPICPFSSISVPDRYGPERQYKIYPFMEGKDIYLWTPERAAAVERARAPGEGTS